jgi:hypothetical protein
MSHLKVVQNVKLLNQLINFIKVKALYVLNVSTLIEEKSIMKKKNIFYELFLKLIEKFKFKKEKKLYKNAS